MALYHKNTPRVPVFSAQSLPPGIPRKLPVSSFVSSPISLFIPRKLPLYPRKVSKDISSRTLPQSSPAPLRRLLFPIFPSPPASRRSNYIPHAFYTAVSLPSLFTPFFFAVFRISLVTSAFMAPPAASFPSAVPLAQSSSREPLFFCWQPGNSSPSPPGTSL